MAQGMYRRICPLEVFLVSDVDDPIQEIEEAEGGWKENSGCSVYVRDAVYMTVGSMLAVL